MGLCQPLQELCQKLQQKLALQVLSAVHVKQGDRSYPGHAEQLMSSFVTAYNQAKIGASCQ